MCGIVAVVRRRSTRRPPSPDELRQALAGAEQALGTSGWPGLDALDAAAVQVEVIDAALRSVPGVQCLIADPDLTAAVDGRLRVLEARVGAIELGLDAGELQPDGADVEAVNAGIVR